MVPVGAIPESLIGRGFEGMQVLVILSPILALALGEIIFGTSRK